MSTVVSTSEYDESIPGWPKFRMVHGTGSASAEVTRAAHTSWTRCIHAAPLLAHFASTMWWPQMFLNGATVVSWRVVNQEMLFVSPKNDYTVGRAVRGGIPVVFRQLAAALSTPPQPAIHSRLPLPAR